MSDATKKAIRYTAELLKKEKEEDLRLFKQQVMETSIDKKRKDGVCWYPIQLNKHFYGTGERLVIEVERTKGLELNHQFSSGKSAGIFVNVNGQAGKHWLQGVIQYVREDLARIVVQEDELPDWIHDGHLGLQLMFEETTYREMERALRIVENASGRAAELREVLIGPKLASFREAYPEQLPQLNPSQNNALHKIMTAEEVAIVHGPPGTGKTTTLVYAIRQVCKKEKQVLVCAPSNAAVDLLTNKLDEMGHQVLRLGHPARVTEASMHHTLDMQIVEHHAYGDLKQVKKQREEYLRLAGKYKRNFGPEERAQRTRLYQEASRLGDEARMLENYITDDLMARAQVITCTLVGASHQLLRDKTFKTVFIDEAGQSLEPASWIPILKARRVVLAGDHFQLPPTIKSLEAAREGLSTTLFEKAINGNEADEMLTIQYRMHEQIMGYSNQQFYKGRLKAHPTVRHHQWEGLAPMLWVDTAGAAYFEQQKADSRSSFNPQEGRVLLDYLQRLAEMPHEELPSVGIIAPYKAQVEWLRAEIDGEWKEHPWYRQISVNTVDAFQGQERDILLMSMVRSNGDYKIGFLQDQRRMNVAMTRARKHLWMIGDSATLSSDTFFDGLLAYVQEIGGYQSVFDPEYFDG
ncbi:AAA domain-containing protein [Persicobacter diffluens]|uniref:Helicase n=1 Tax=Persicobacter diffluens TaxID=981 RepID=A0AAN4VWT1_9BACT|nr:helicase [Persicobacter diffluens]